MAEHRSLASGNPTAQVEDRPTFLASRRNARLLRIVEEQTDRALRRVERPRSCREGSTAHPCAEPVEFLPDLRGLALSPSAHNEDENWGAQLFIHRPSVSSQVMAVSPTEIHLFVEREHRCSLAPPPVRVEPTRLGSLPLPPASERRSVCMLYSDPPAPLMVATRLWNAETAPSVARYSRACAAPRHTPRIPS